MTEHLRVISHDSETYVNVDDLIGFIKSTPPKLEEKYVAEIGQFQQVIHGLVMNAIKDTCRYFTECLESGSGESDFTIDWH